MNIVRCCSSRIPAYPWLGWVGPPLHFHLGLGQVSGGTLSGSSPPQKKTKTVRDSFPSYGSNHSHMPREASFPCLLGWFTRAQTSTGRNSREL
ncbi:hypothetical protein VNO77_46354 [Canavalia gladiata]|uniref:Uncharacterized protein n=1 Tax=Canavalia gladiata TaxID=3824 RepID=A0AAN9JGN8_CANGL